MFARTALRAAVLVMMLGTPTYGRDLPPPAHSMDWRAVNPGWVKSVCGPFPLDCGIARAAAQSCPGAGTLAVLAFQMPQHNPILIPDSLDPITIRFILMLWKGGYSGPNADATVADTANMGCLARTFAPQALRAPPEPPIGAWDHP